jgi:hypothetical protein
VREVAGPLEGDHLAGRHIVASSAVTVAPGQLPPPPIFCAYSQDLY